MNAPDSHPTPDPEALAESDDRTRLGRLDLQLIAEGRHRALGRTLGAQTITDVPTPGVRFAVWAPNARSVAVVGRFVEGDSRRAMQHCGAGGVWELFVPGLEPGFVYQYEIVPVLDREPLPLKADPVALQCEPAPRTGSIVASAAPHVWTDAEWLDARAQRQARAAPISIYELHVASWRRHADGRTLNWHELAIRLLPYVADLGFTHIELLPVMAHPFGGSWGYQPLGLYAPQPDWGTPDEFATFVDRCHARGIGVILDWVPAHFPTDAHGLAHFDGSALYEHADPREGFHPDWNTLIYNLGRREVRGFVLASALHWLERYHVDGLRVDAVASMLYRDYSRRPGEWIPNHDGGRENYESMAFLRELNTVVAEEHPGVLLIAEESTAWPGVTHPVHEGGLGFDYKWNMGWMHDSLQYLAQDPIHRRWHHELIGFGLAYAFSEHFILPLSHDEVVHGKGSLLRRMPGDRWQRFANLRAYFGFMWAHPGKKLLFMGGEFAQEREWNHDAQLDWHLLDDAQHCGVQSAVRDLNRLLRSEPALHGRDGNASGFEWIVQDDQQNSVFAFCRHGPPGSAPLLAISNFTPVPRHHYRVGVPRAGRWCELFNSDAAAYGGSNIGNQGGADSQAIAAHSHAQSLSLTLPPLATLLLRAPGEPG